MECYPEWRRYSWMFTRACLKKPQITRPSREHFTSLQSGGWKYQQLVSEDETTRRRDVCWSERRPAASSVQHHWVRLFHLFWTFQSKAQSTVKRHVNTPAVTWSTLNQSDACSHFDKQASYQHVLSVWITPDQQAPPTFTPVPSFLIIPPAHLPAWFFSFWSNLL